MTEKRYLKWYNKVGYGSGDIAGNVVYGTMYSCTSLGVKLGGGLGTAITGWLLAASHFDSALTVQPDSCINMLKIMYLVIPFALDAIITFLLSRMKVEEANEKLRAAV